MDLALLVYGISLLNGFTGLVGMAIVVTGVVTIICTIGTLTWVFDGSEYSWNLDKDGNLKPRIAAARKRMVQGIKWGVPAVVVLSFIAVLIPTEKTAYTMVGAYAAQKVAEDPRVKDVGGKVLTIINQKLDQYVDEGVEQAAKKAEEVAKKAKK
jgi:hypothetical protein